MNQRYHINRSLSSRGFTVIEMVAVIVIMGTLAVVITPMVITASSSYTDSTHQRTAVSSLNYALDRISRLFREASPAVDGTTDITTALPGKVVFDDGSMVELIGTTLWFTAAGQTAQPLAQNINQFTISYLQKDGVTNSSSSPNTTHRVTIVIASDGVELRSAVFLRETMVISAY